MKKTENTNYEWKLVAYNNKDQVVAYPVPNTVVGDIIKILFEAGKGDTCLPSEEISDMLSAILEKKVNLEFIAKLSGLSREYLDDLVKGIFVPAKTKNVMLLTEIIDKLK